MFASGCFDMTSFSYRRRGNTRAMSSTVAEREGHDNARQRVTVFTCAMAFTCFQVRGLRDSELSAMHVEPSLATSDSTSRNEQMRNRIVCGSYAHKVSSRGPRLFF